MKLAVDAGWPLHGLEDIRDADTFVGLELPPASALRPPLVSGRGETDKVLEPDRLSDYVLEQLAPGDDRSLWAPCAYAGQLRRALRQMEQEACLGGEVSRHAGQVLRRTLAHFDLLGQSRQALLQG